ncbi:RING-H2 finger protein ATL67-like [Alnus glutinosa]|uniref:RING-H2 finger protein ATL67-like n=1 Tax=Alnus glutinosa TaxID=3517 RepID=UPI002D77E9F1|nr:RING-H2 finger protein ATL67-like [Alnus glutinosa]
MSTPPQSSTGYLTNLGLGYAIAVALGFLVLLSTVLLASYLCCRSHRSPNAPNNNHHRSGGGNNNNPNDGIILPRIIFVAEDDEDEEQLRDENVAVGLDQSVINSYPKFPYFRKDGNTGSNSTTCSICLCEYKESEMLRMMPECRHYFHMFCLDAWLKLNGSCPVCRNSPLPTPLSTPLSEVVPLSQYAADRRRRR